MARNRLDDLRALRMANLDVAFATAFGTLVGGAFLVGFVKDLGGSDHWIGLLAAVPSLLGILQVPGAIWGRGFSSYKRFVLPGGLLWRVLYIPIVLLPLVALQRETKLLILGLCVSLAAAAVLPVNPIYSDWLAEMVPSTSRGWYFSRRNSIAAGVGAAVGAVGAFILDAFKSQGQSEVGYTVVFGMGILCAAISFAAFLSMKDLPRANPIREPLGKSLSAFILPLKDRRYKGVLIFLAVFVIGQGFAGNLFSAFAIESLKLPFTVIQLAAAAHAVGSISLGSLWGFLADKYGNRPLLFVLAIGLTLSPAIWLVCTPGQTTLNTIYLIVGHLYSGAVWGGVAVCQFNLMLATAKEEDRANYLGVAMSLTALMGGIAPLLGAELMAYFRGEFEVETAYKLVIGGAMALRFASILFLIPVREEGAVRLRETLRHLSKVTPRGMATLRSLSKSANPESKERAIQSAGSTELRVAADEVAASLHDPSPRVRRQAAATLAKIGDEKAVEALIHMLHDHPDLVEEETIEALGELAQPQAAEILAKYLRNPRSMVRRAAAKALGRIGDPSSIAPLLEGAVNTDDPDLRRASLQALRLMEAREVEEVVASALEDPHPSVRIAAAEAISEMMLTGVADAVRRSLEHFHDEAESEVAYTLGCVGTVDDIPTILREAAECRSMITRRRCLLGVARLIGVEHEAYRLLLAEGMSRDAAVLETLRPLTRKNRRVRAALERYSAGDEAGAIDALRHARPGTVLDQFGDSKVSELFLVAAVWLRSQES